MKSIWIFPIIRALEAREEWLSESETVDNSEELPVIKEALNYFKGVGVKMEEETPEEEMFEDMVEETEEEQIGNKNK
jgi:hypothetical protein